METYVVVYERKNKKFGTIRSKLESNQLKKKYGSLRELDVKSDRSNLYLQVGFFYLSSWRILQK